MIDFDDIGISKDLDDSAESRQAVITNNNFDCFVRFEDADGEYRYSLSLEKFEDLAEWVEGIKEEYESLLSHKNYRVNEEG